MRILDTFTPTQTQKRVLALVSGAATPTVAGDAISVGANMVSARDTLVRLGFVSFVNGEATLTDQGTQLAVAENIIDDTGGLSQAGQALAQTQPSQPEQTPPPAPGLDTAPMEAFATLKSLLL